MNTAQLVTALRSAADALEDLGVDAEKYRPSVDLYFHDIDVASDLAAIARILEFCTTNREDDTHWIRGRLHGVSVAAFYEPGLLGPKTQRPVEVEESPDLETFLSTQKPRGAKMTEGSTAITQQEWDAMTPPNRLRWLASATRTVADRFDFSGWVGDDWEGAPDLSCGTTACVGGWATVWLPWILRLNSIGDVLNRWTGSTSARALADAAGIDIDVAIACFLPRAWEDGDDDEYDDTDISPLLHERLLSETASAEEVAVWLERHADALEAQS